LNRTGGKFFQLDQRVTANELSQFWPAVGALARMVRGRFVFHGVGLAECPQTMAARHSKTSPQKLVQSGFDG
jgi:hypothetical protein